MFPRSAGQACNWSNETARIDVYVYVLLVRIALNICFQSNEEIAVLDAWGYNTNPLSYKGAIAKCFLLEN